MILSGLVDNFLQLGDQLAIRVIATSTQGDSPASIPSSSLLAFPPLAPINLVSSGTSATQIGLKWEPPIED